MAADMGYLNGPLATLPKPSLTFTVPSLHDGLPIDCRVYHPQSLAASPDAPPWQKHAAIIAHPYAPLGGCYDDPTVDIVAGILLRLGFLVGTFNFRGAHGSAGRTSWTAKAERADYMSVVGVVSHYVHFLDPFKPAIRSRPESAGHDDGGVEADGAIRIRPPTPSLPELSGATPILLLGGYSYGAMVTSQLPYLETIAAVFDKPECGTPAAEIRLRAQHLAEMQNTILASAREAAVDHLRPVSPRKHVGLRVGGDEESRKSHEYRRSLSAEFEETIRHGVAELMAKTRKGHRRSHSGQGRTARDPDGAPEQNPEHLLPIPGQITFQPAYLLVSPLQGIVTNLATMSLPLLSTPGKVWARLSAKPDQQTAQAESGSGSAVPEGTVSVEAEDKLVQNSTLAIYGNRDGFVPVRKLRDWASRLQAVQGSKFRAHEVSSATHFWAQHNVVFTLQEAVRAFAASLLDEKTS
ncbi:Alpha/Beta hydrolase protein [Chaetomidium leptoderma]|uniref:Alpha/Beta hydrolase protein n=1 Tax=Chaetomidium leptoderma TaxID=669021 RepID=A0AAN6ZX94_9PEZI|nr:Alpha/Beta hydrolase protein [Chaetomidium leptoderma]